MRIPGRSDTRTYALVKRIVRILPPAGNVVHKSKAEDRVIHLSSQSGAFSLSKIVRHVDCIPALINQHYLLAGLLIRRHLQCVREAIGQRKARLHVPCIAPVRLVIGNDALVLRVRAQRKKMKIRSSSGVESLRLTYDSKHVGRERLEIALLR